jgi:stalled ribosome rescue protein Dom34
LGKVDEVLKGFGEDGWDWEYSVIETRRDLWKINGIVPPEQGTEVRISTNRCERGIRADQDGQAEKEWVRLNRAVEYEKEESKM